MPKGALFYQPLIDFLITSGPPAAPRIMFCSDCKQYQALRDPSPHDQPLIDFLITRTSPPTEAHVLRLKGKINLIQVT